MLNSVIRPFPLALDDRASLKQPYFHSVESRYGSILIEVVFVSYASHST